MQFDGILIDFSKVIVKEEYLIYDLLSMIGSVGGTMGLCIGFSFANLSGCFINFVETVMNRVTKKQRCSDLSRKDTSLYYRIDKIEAKFVILEQKMDARVSNIGKLLHKHGGD